MKSSKALLVPLIIAIISFFAQFSAEISQQYLIYQRESIFAGQWWRLLSGHLVHLGWIHLVMNLLGLLAIGLIAGDKLDSRAWLISLIASAVFISLGLLVFSPEVIWYVGLSGVLHALLVITALTLISSKDVTGWLILIFISGKVIWEQWAGPSSSLEASIGGNVVIDAHLYGVLSGVVIGLLLRGFLFRHQSKR